MPTWICAIVAATAEVVTFPLTVMSGLTVIAPVPEAIVASGGTSASSDSLNSNSLRVADVEKVEMARVASERIPGRQCRKLVAEFMVGLSRNGDSI